MKTSTLLRLPARFDSEHYVRGLGHALAFAGALTLVQGILFLAFLFKFGAL
jgi:hypothetical protein